MSSVSPTSISAATSFEKIRQLCYTLIEQRDDLHVQLRQSQAQVETLSRENHDLKMVSDGVYNFQEQADTQFAHQRAQFAARQHRALEFELKATRRLIEDLLDQNSSYRALVKKLNVSVQGWLSWFLRNGGSTQQHERPRPYVVVEQQAASKPGPEWIRSTWLSEPDQEKPLLLANAEVLYRRHEDRKALEEVGTLLKRTDLPDKEHANAQLFMAAMLCACNNPGPAIYHAEMGYILAKKAGSNELAGKAQFHRGIAFLILLRFAEASHCFSLAEGTPLHEDEITLWKARSESARLRFPEGHPKRLLERSFVPRPGTA
ncbi:MAG: hypothetical protein M1823_004240 [Watsoniomyces obsoletus]|nr:MAG: hypothetical protein M1823_004240 [Watsoniomyces obsoletus]